MFVVPEPGEVQGDVDVLPLAEVEPQAGIPGGPVMTAGRTRTAPELFVELASGFCVDDATVRVVGAKVETSGDWTAYDVEGVRRDVEAAVMAAVKRRRKTAET